MTTIHCHAGFSANREDINNLIKQLRHELRLTNRRIPRLYETQKRKPDWKFMDDKYAMDYITIDILIEEWLAMRD